MLSFTIEPYCQQFFDFQLQMRTELSTGSFKTHFVANSIFNIEKWLIFFDSGSGLQALEVELCLPSGVFQRK